MNAGLATAPEGSKSLQVTDRRRHQRVQVNILGRFMLEDRREYPCQVIDMSPGGMAMITPVTGKVGERDRLLISIISAVSKAGYPD